jgi:integrase
MPRSLSFPTYRHHKPSGQAVVTVRTLTGVRRDVYLGAYNSPESRAEYARILAELSVSPGAVGTPSSHRLTVDEIILRFLEHAARHYRHADGTPTDQLTEYKNALKPLHALYGNTPAADFGPLALKAVRQQFVSANNCRNTVNSRVGKLKRVFKWAVENELVPVATYQALATVSGLPAGRGVARESAPVLPVADADIEAVLPHLNRHVRGLVQLQRLSGCRPGEAMALRRADIDISGDVWLYKPASHKTTWKGKVRVIALGPKAQELLKGYFTDDPADYLFSPARAAEEFRAERAANRKTPLYPSHMKRNDTKRVGAARTRKPREMYKRQSYLTAVERACDRAFPTEGKLAREQGESAAKWWERLTAEQRAAVKVWRREHRWNPYRLRHSFATEVRKRHGLEGVQVALGHANARVTEVYAARDLALAVRVASELG